MFAGAKWRLAVAGLVLLAAAACDNGGGGGGGQTAEATKVYSLADLAGAWNYYYVNKGGFGGTITWSADGKIAKWLDPACGSGIVISAMVFAVTAEGMVTGTGKAYCSNSNPATADVLICVLTFRSDDTMKGTLGDAGDQVAVVFYRK